MLLFKIINKLLEGSFCNITKKKRYAELNARKLSMKTSVVKGSNPRFNHRFIISGKKKKEGENHKAQKKKHKELS